MATKKILMACGNYWTSTFQVGSHHLAHAFVKNGYQVAFISDPISPLHVANGISIELKDRFKIFRQGGVWNDNHTIWTYIPAALATPHNKMLLRSEWLQQNWHKLTIPNVIQKIIQNGFGDVDLIYFDSMNQAYLLDLFTYKKSVFRIADNFAGFSKATPASMHQEKKLAQRVDCVAYTAKSLEPSILKLHPKQSLFFPNGVNFSHFSRKSEMLPTEYQKIKKPIVLYVGAMDFWFDFECVNVLAKSLPDIAFVLIGPDNLAKLHLKQLPNIYLLGRRSYEDLPPYIHHADIGIIPFDRKGYAELVDHINPLKLYEYMASGLPVVSTRWKELENLNTRAKLVDSHTEFVQKIKETLQEPKHSELLQEFAKQFEWNERVKELF